jgi:hypothetical protein
MKYGSLPRSIRRSLPASSIGPAHMPDGLDEAAIEALAAEAGIDLDLESPSEVDQPIGEVVSLWPVDQDTAEPLGNEAA